jgi:biotin operon repressor
MKRAKQSGRRRPPPKEFVFDTDREEWWKRHYYMPTRLVTKGTLRDLWLYTDAGRSALGLVPLLGLHADNARWRLHKNTYTPLHTIRAVEVNISYRRLARVLACSKTTIAYAIDALADCALVKKVRSRTGHVIRVMPQLLTSYNEAGAPSETFVDLEGWMLYGGLWTAMLPPIRYAYLAIAARNPILDDEKFRASIRRKRRKKLRRLGHPIMRPDLDRVVELAVQKKRQQEAPTRADIVRDTGMSRTTVHHAVTALCAAPDPAALAAPAPLLGSGMSANGDYYVPGSTSYSLRWPCEVLNDRARVNALRRLLWPTWPVRDQ